MTSPYRDPDQIREFLEEDFKSFFSEVDATEKAQADAQAAAEAAKATQDAEDRLWGFVEPPESLADRQPLPADHFRFADVVKEPWCLPHYKTPSRLIKWLLKVHGYPDRLVASGLITRAGFDILMENKRLAECKSDLALKAKARAAERTALAEARRRFLELLCLRVDVLL
jgi:hypothetical protein